MIIAITSIKSPVSNHNNEHNGAMNMIIISPEKCVSTTDLHHFFGEMTEESLCSQVWFLEVHSKIANAKEPDFN